MTSAGKMNVCDKKLRRAGEKVGNSSTLHCLCLPRYDEALLLTKRKLRASCEKSFFWLCALENLCMSTMSKVSSEAP